LKVYLDTSVITIYLFGPYSKRENRRLPSVNELFKRINEKHLHALISLYTLQEIYIFCKIHFATDEVGHIAKKALAFLFQNDFELIGLLSREDHLIYNRQFNLDDPSDQPHAISAYLSKCDAIITYDTHFQKIKDKIPAYTPEEAITK